MIKILDLIRENQVFNWEDRKDQLLNNIVGIRTNTDTSSTLYPPLEDNLYAILRKGDITTVSAIKQLGFTKAEEDKWQQIFSQPLFTVRGDWSQVNFISNSQKTAEKGTTLNYYITVVKTKDNILNFIKGIPDLNKVLKELSDKYKSTVSWKTHNKLYVFLGDNDSLKVYYYDGAMKQDIENTVKDWAKRNNIQLGTRTHSHGFDSNTPITIGGKTYKGSYGQILAKIIADQLTNVVEKNKDKYTDEQYFQWLKVETPKIIQSIQIKY